MKRMIYIQTNILVFIYSIIMLFIIMHGTISKYQLQCYIIIIISVIQI